MLTDADHLSRVRDPAVELLLSHAGQYDTRCGRANPPATPTGTISCEGAANPGSSPTCYTDR